MTRPTCQVALDDGPGPPIKYQYAELGKLYQVVSGLVRCCDVSGLAQSSVEGQAPLSNPYHGMAQQGYLMTIQPQVKLVFYLGKNNELTIISCQGF